MKKVTTKITVEVEVNESDLTEENINKYKENMYKLLEEETDENAKIQVVVEIE